MKVKLANYDAAQTALDQARTHDEVQDIADKTIQMFVYQKQAKNFDLERAAQAIRTRAERAHGLLKNRAQEAGLIAKRGGDRKSEGFKNQMHPQGAIDSKPVKTLGFTRKQQARQSALAKVPDHIFEEDVKAGLTPTEIIKKNTPVKPALACAMDEKSACGMDRIPDKIRAELITEFVEDIRHALAIFQSGLGEYDVEDLLKKLSAKESAELLDVTKFVLERLRETNLREWFSELKQILEG